MTTILAFEAARTKPATGAARIEGKSKGPARILLFTGIRREPLKAGTEIPAARRCTPMFDDPLPGKPRSRKQRRSKNG